jgi:hypothetical protein
MNLRLKDAISSVDYHELVDFHEDLENGAIATKQLVKETILAKEKEMGKMCHVCQSEIDPHSTHNYTLLLGPEGLRRKASFCALDCLKYFLSDIERRQEEFKRKNSADVSQVKNG